MSSQRRTLRTPLSQGTQSQSQSQSQSSKKKPQKKNKDKSWDDSELSLSADDLAASERWSVEEMVTNVIQYLFVLQNKNIPVKKAEIIKHAMNRQGPQFRSVMEEVAETLDSIFGVRLIGFKGTVEIAETVGEGMYFMIVSKYRKCPLNLGDQKEFEHLDEKYVKTGLLRSILSCLYMLSREMDELELWNIVEKSEASAIVCPRQEDLRKLLKQEYVDTMYLHRTEIKGIDGSSFRYSWGLRAELECDKYQLLKSISKEMKKTPYDFRLQLIELMNDEKYSQQIQDDYNRWGERSEEPESEPESDPEPRSVEDEETQELELEDIPESNMGSVAGGSRKDKQQQPSGRRARRIVETESDESDFDL